MFLNAHSLANVAHVSASSTVETFNWLLVLGFPVEVAAAKALPEIFTDATSPQFVSDGVRVFERCPTA